MEIIDGAHTMQARMLQLRQAGKTIGFVPTMGYLHEGHLTLMRMAKAKAGILVVSIFINPTQFGPQEDLAKYPRNMERDCALLREVGCDFLFTPTNEIMYPPGFAIFIEPGEIARKMCGASRPGHFRGVATVVAKLFNIVQPQVTIFGQKDAQQAIIIKKMAVDLNMPLEIVVGPIVREPDGLAMSSRNIYLSATERQEALVLSQALQLAQRLIENGQRGKQVILDQMRELIETAPAAKIDYIEIVNGDNLAAISELGGLVLLAVAVWIGKTRLIDNLIIDMTALPSQT